MVRSFRRVELERARRLQNEQAITAPIQAVTYDLRNRLSAANGELRSLREVISNPLAKGVIEHIERKLAEELRRTIISAMATARHGDTTPVTVTLSAEMLRFMDPQSLESMALEQYRQRALPDMSIWAGRDLATPATIVRVSIPSLHFQAALS